jgi:hypothetical protein
MSKQRTDGHGSDLAQEGDSRDEELLPLLLKILGTRLVC